MSNVGDKNLSQTGLKKKERKPLLVLIPERFSYLSQFSHVRKGELPGIDGDNAYRQGAHEAQDDRYSHIFIQLIFFLLQ